MSRSISSKTCGAAGGSSVSRLPALQGPRVEQLEDRLLLSLLGIGDQLGWPEVTYDSGGGVAYDAVDAGGSQLGAFDSSATPMYFYFSESARRVRIAVPRDFQLHIRLDSSGNVVSGVAGDDLRIEGVISADVNSDGIIENYSGVLLTGEIMRFGFFDSGGTTDQYDFRFRPTGGVLLPFYQGKDIGLTMDSMSSTFTGNFAVDFQGWAQGVVGPIAPLPGSLAGLVFDDVNDNGVADGGEAGIAGATIVLSGTDVNGNTVTRTTTTGADGSYLFAGMAPGIYQLTELQPAGYIDGTDSVGTLGGMLISGTGGPGDDAVADIEVGSGQNGTGYIFGELMPGSLAGRVFVDANNNGVIDTGEAGIAGVSVALSGTDVNGNAVNLTATTGADGSYLFGGLAPGTYHLGEAQPAGYIDGSDSVGSLGGSAGNDILSGIAVGSGQNGTGYTFGELMPAGLTGLVYEDFNDDGLIDFNECAIEGVTVTLTGVDDRGNAVNTATQTDSDGQYFFELLRPGVYAITETQPANYRDGKDTPGTLGGTAGNDVLSGIGLGAGVLGMDYNFGERPLVGSALTSGQTATIGFWQNKNGQALLTSLNGGSSAMQLGDWLAATFPNLYGAGAGSRNLAGMSNAQVAAVYRDELFKGATGKNVKGPAKVEAQVMATVFATYVTNSTLAGTAAARYGFIITEYGVGNTRFNVGTCGAAFGVANGTQMAILDLLKATDARSVQGRLYDLNVLLRTLANTVYTAINEAGKI